MYRKLQYLYLCQCFNKYDQNHFWPVIQGVHKVFRQVKNFITKAVDEISYIDLFYINQCLLKILNITTLSLFIQFQSDILCEFLRPLVLWQAKNYYRKMYRKSLVSLPML